MGFLSPGYAQTTHLIRGYDFYYLPDTVYLEPGDSIKFQPQGIHDMVQTDSAYWAINQAISNGGFVTTIGVDTTFVIDTVGTYYFVCSPHGFNGMRGVLLVDSLLSTSVHTADLRNTVAIHPSPAVDHIRFPCGEGTAHADVRSSSGMMHGRIALHTSGWHRMDVSTLASGRYVLVLLDRSGLPHASGSFVIVR